LNQRIKDLQDKKDLQKNRSNTEEIKELTDARFLLRATLCYLLFALSVCLTLNSSFISLTHFFSAIYFDTAIMEPFVVLMCTHPYIPN